MQKIFPIVIVVATILSYTHFKFDCQMEIRDEYTIDYCQSQPLRTKGTYITFYPWVPTFLCVQLFLWAMSLKCALPFHILQLVCLLWFFNIDSSYSSFDTTALCLYDVEKFGNKGIYTCNLHTNTYYRHLFCFLFVYIVASITIDAFTLLSTCIEKDCYRKRRNVYKIIV
jgi:hypothetical protein